MRYEVVIRTITPTAEDERVVAVTRREAGAINERNIAADSEYAIKCKHNEDGSGRVVWGTHEDDPRAYVVTYYDEFTTITTIITYREKR